MTRCRHAGSDEQATKETDPGIGIRSSPKKKDQRLDDVTRRSPAVNIAGRGVVGCGRKPTLGARNERRTNALCGRASTVAAAGNNETMAESIAGLEL